MQHDWVPPDCAGVRDFPPGPPPDVKVRNLNQTVHKAGEDLQHSIIVTLVCMTLIAWLLVFARRRRRLLARGLKRFILPRLRPESEMALASPRRRTLQTLEPHSSREASGFSTTVSSSMPGAPRPYSSESSGGLHHRVSGGRKKAGFLSAAPSIHSPSVSSIRVTSNALLKNQYSAHCGRTYYSTVGRRAQRLHVTSILLKARFSPILAKYPDAYSPWFSTMRALLSLGHFFSASTGYIGLQSLYKYFVWQSVCIRPGIGTHTVELILREDFPSLMGARGSAFHGLATMSTSNHCVSTRKTESLLRVLVFAAATYKTLAQDSVAPTGADPFSWSSLLLWLLLRGVSQKARQEVSRVRWGLAGSLRGRTSARQTKLRAEIGEALQNLQLGLSELSRSEARLIWETMRRGPTRHAVLFGEQYGKSSERQGIRGR